MRRVGEPAPRSPAPPGAVPDPRQPSCDSLSRLLPAHNGPTGDSATAEPLLRGEAVPASMRHLDLPTRRPVAVLLAILGLTLFFVSRIVDFRTGEVHLRVDPAVERLLPRGDENQAFYETVRRRFGSDEALVLAFLTDDVFRLENLHRIERIAQRLEDAEGVDRVVSLATAVNVRAADGDILVQPFLAELPRSAADAERIRADVLRNPVYAGNLVSRDNRATAFVVYLEEMPEQDFIDQKIDLRIREVAEQAGGDGRIWMTGPPHVKAATARLLLEDLSKVIPAAFGIMAVIGILSFRTLRGVLLPIVTILLSLTWTLALLAWTRTPLNLVTTSLPPLLLTIGFAYAVHVMSAYYEALREPEEKLVAKGGAASWALRHVALAVALTGLTTAVGFSSLLTSRFDAVREFGFVSVVGVVFTVVIALTLIPAVLQLLGPPRRGMSEHSGAGRIVPLMEALGRFDLRHRVPILLAGGALLLVSLVGMTQIRVSTDLITNFGAENPVRRQFEAINEALEGASPFSIVVQTDVDGALVRPENLREIESLQAWLAEQPEIGGSTSLVDFLKLLNRAFHDDDPDALAIPERAALAKQLLLFGASDELDRFVDSNYRTLNVHVRSKAVDSQGLADLIRRIEERLGQLPSYLPARVTGDVTLLTRAIDDVAQGQVESLSLAFVFIYVILVALFTSFRVGLVALLPNVIPVALYFGLLGLAGVTLNPTTGLVACIVLGIAVDDTIHFLTRFNAEARERVDERGGAVRALRSVGLPVTVTTIGLCLGFLTLTLSQLKNQVEFGALAAVTLFFAWLVDVTFTPALCGGLRIVTLWDALTYDLGEEPQKSIPVLRGLSKAQARIAALTTNVVKLPAGATVFRAGDPGDELYVVIEGELSVSGEIGGRRMELARVRRGDVVGEVALYHGKRTADVEAVTDVRALRLTRDNLHRLRRRYPRIGAQVLWNLSEILALRVANVTEKAR